MYSFKTILWRNYELYTKHPNDEIGITKFYDSWMIAYVCSCVIKKININFYLIDQRNSLIKKWLHAIDNDLSQAIFKQVLQKDYKLIMNFLDHLETTTSKSDSYSDFAIDRTHVLGCVGTVIE